MQLHDEGILEIGNQYTVGTNDGREISHIRFIGYKLLNGKPMMATLMFIVFSIKPMEDIY